MTINLSCTARLADSNRSAYGHHLRYHEIFMTRYKHYDINKKNSNITYLQFCKHKVTVML